jgi:hypothetical protein
LLRIVTLGNASHGFATQRIGLTNGGFMAKGNGKRPSFELHADTLTLIEAMSQANYGDVATNQALSELIGRSVQTEARGNLTSALNVLARDYAIFFNCVRGHGWMRVTESEYIDIVPREQRGKIRNAAHRGQKRLSAVPDSKLSREEVTKKLSGMAGLGALKEFAKEPTVKEAPERPQAAPNASKKALDLFKKK